MRRKLKLAILLSGCVLAYSQDKPNPNFTGGEVKTIKENSDGKSAHFYFSPGCPHEMAQPRQADKLFWWKTASACIRKRADRWSSCEPGKRTTVRQEWCIGTARRPRRAELNLT